uniref:Uncharacterized protein n=1 Tax=Arundo donax TaxID=35708 RepID=A0A0A9GPG4_ARUDO
MVPYPANTYKRFLICIAAPSKRTTGASAISSHFNSGAGKSANVALMSMEPTFFPSFVFFFAAGGAGAVGPVRRLSLEDQIAADEEDEEAHRKSATRTRPRMATTARATRCFGGRAFAAGLAIGRRAGGLE